MKICLDAGHFGKYNQSPVNPAYWESDFTWKFHLMLKAELEKYGIEVVTTRPDQACDLKLETRGRKSAGCDLFLSIHSNACNSESADYALACCCVNGTADVIGHELAETVGKIMGASGKSNILKKKQSDGRDWYGVLRGAASVGTPGVLLEHGFHTNRKNTRWLLNDDNLQRMAVEEARVIAEYFGVESVTDATAENSGNTSNQEKFATDATEKRVWNKLISAGLTEAGSAGLMGNLKAESNLIPNNLQDTFEKKLGFTDTTYTAAVDAGTYTNFERDGAGYGLAQWTYHTRKAALLAFAKAQGVSIGNLDMQMDFLLKELQEGYTGLYNLLRITDSIQVASDAVLTQFERPADMSASVKQKRAGYGTALYNALKGTKPSDSVQNAVQGAFFVKVVCKELNVRKGAGVDFDVVMKVRCGEAFTIVETARAKDGGTWGRLKSGAGWMNIGNGYCKRVNV